MSAFAPVDIVVGAILAIAVLRGLFLGVIRESFSIAALGGACITVKLFSADVGAWLEATSEGQVGSVAAPWLAGAMLAVGTIAVVVLAGRVLRRGARWAGLGLADRAAGAVLGVAEGALVVGILLGIGTMLLGRDHPVLTSSLSFGALEQLERIAQGPAPPGPSDVDVAAPPGSL